MSDSCGLDYCTAMTLKGCCVHLERKIFLKPSHRSLAQSSPLGKNLEQLVHPNTNSETPEFI